MDPQQEPFFSGVCLYTHLELIVRLVLAPACGACSQAGRMADC